MRQRHPCISHGSNVEHNALRSWHATMYKLYLIIYILYLPFAGRKRKIFALVILKYLKYELF